MFVFGKCGESVSMASLSEENEANMKIDWNAAAAELRFFYPFSFENSFQAAFSLR